MQEVAVISCISRKFRRDPREEVGTADGSGQVSNN
jgi:hypothetical protein